MNHAKEKVSILEDVDFELELIHRDEINVAYIIRLLIKLKANQKKDAATNRKRNIQPTEYRNPVKKQEGTDRKIHKGKYANYSGHR